MDLGGGAAQVSTRRGLTLVEVVASLVILALLVTASVPLMPHYIAFIVFILGCQNREFCSFRHQIARK